MKTILTKIEFHYTYLIMALGLVLTGHFINLIVFTSLIIIHEIGHIIPVLIFKYKIDKIIIYPYGGLTKFDKLINIPIYKDIIIAVAGLLMQSIYFIIILLLYENGFIREYIYNLFLIYHRSMLLFNILPIIPLDGSKLVNLFLSKYINFNLSNNLTVLISFITLIIVIFGNIFDNNYTTLMSLGILLFNIYKYYTKLSFIYNKFILERYLYNIKYKRIKIIKDETKMYRSRSHLFKENNVLIKEKDYLRRIFEKKR